MTLQLKLEKFPTPNKECLLREESFGGIIFHRNTGAHRFLDEDEYRLLSFINGQYSVYETAKALSSEEIDIAKKILTIFHLEQDSWLSLADGKSTSGYNISKYKTKSTDALSTPMFVSLAIIDECNVECNHCYKLLYQTGQPLTSLEIRRTIDSLAESHVFQMSITGGEPFLSEDVIEIICYAGASIPQISVASNGLLITRKIAERLVSANISTIQIGINAVFDNKNRESENKSRIRVENSLGYLNDVNIPVQIGAVLTRNVIANLDKIIEMASEYQIPAIKFSPLVNYHPGCSACKADNNDIIQVVSRLQRLHCESSGTEFVFDDGIFDAVRDNASTLEQRKRYCYMGTGIMHIETDGSIYPCSGLLSSDFLLGNVRDYPSAIGLYNLWQNSEVLQSIRSITIDSLDDCQGCKYLRICAGGCRSSAYWATGDLLGSYPFCEVNKAVIKDYYENCTC